MRQFESLSWFLPSETPVVGSEPHQIATTGELETSARDVE